MNLCRALIDRAGVEVEVLSIPLTVLPNENPQLTVGQR